MIDEHKAKIILWGITIITGILVLRCLFSPNKAWIFPLLILLILSCPKIDERINKITKATTTFYFEKFRMLCMFVLPIAVPFIAIYMVTIFSSKNISESKLFLEVEMVLKIGYYITYILIAFLYHKTNKKNKYIFFGIYYFLCIIISYIPVNDFWGNSADIII